MIDFEKLAAAMGDLDEDAVEVLKPFLASGEGSGVKSKMIICTVKDDLHDIGKNIVRSMLEAAGFDVLDLGIDVAPEKIIETAKAENIRIIALSGVLTLALDSMKKTVAAFKEAGMDDVKIIIGGCRICKECAYPSEYRFPQKACRDVGVPYYYGEKNIAYTACVLF